MGKYHLSGDLWINFYNYFSNQINLRALTKKKSLYFLCIFTGTIGTKYGQLDPKHQT